MGEPFFSPHPVAELYTKEEILDFLARRKEAYAVLVKGELKDLRGLAPENFNLEILRQIGHTYIVKIGTGAI